MAAAERNLRQGVVGSPRLRSQCFGEPVPGRCAGICRFARANDSGDTGPARRFQHASTPLSQTTARRGFKAGTAIGDNLLTGSLELRTPLTSPFSIGKAGVNAFVDAGTVYDDGQRLTDQSIDVGVGAGVWFSAAIIRFNVAVAHGIDASTHVHFAANLSF